jgi:radical SAM superfamily enzyme YgiQ (UPF0313 family)
MPIGLAYIAAVLERDGCDVRVVDCLVSQYTAEKIRKAVGEHQPDIVGTTSVTLNYPVASEILRYCKEASPDAVTVIGGPHVTFRPLETLTEAPWIDVVVRGEGEQTVLEIVRRRKLEDIAGIAYRAPEGIRLTKDRELITDLDALPLPARHLFPLSKYLALGCHCSLVAGRGCPFNCVFCVGSKMGGRRARYRDPRLIADEVETAIGYGFTEINFEDDLLTLNHDHVRTFCDEILSRGLRFNWSAFSRADTVNAEILPRMNAAGCTWLLYGVESGNQAILDRAKKKITLDRIRQGVELAKEHGIEVMASFIIGLPGETRETLQDTVDFARELGAFYGFNVLAPFPGTEVWERAAEYGIEILTDDWTKYDANQAVSRTQEVGPDEVNEVLRDYYEALGVPPIGSDAQADQAGGGSGRRRSRSTLAWYILQNDVIESLGGLRAGADPVKELVNKVAERTQYPRDHVDENIRRWVVAGLLRHDSSGDHVVWRWS